MSTLPENELDLEKLFLPAWAQEPASAKQYSNYQGGEERREHRGDRNDRMPGRRPGPSGDRRRDSRPGGDRRGPRRDAGDNRSFDQRKLGLRHDEPRERREPPPSLPDVNLTFIPDERGVESLARQIKMTGRAYPLFDIARLILQKPERHSIAFSVSKNAEGKPVQPLFVCALDETLWLSEEAAVSHVMKNHFATFYQTERTATEPPKGKYTFVAQCGMSGVILGPPNYHDYQNQLRKLHTERFSRMPFEVFKARVKIVREEEVVKKWMDEQSWKTDFVCLNMPEPLRLASREAVEKHFLETHKETIIKPAESHTVTGVAARAMRSPELTRLVRQVWEDQRRFPLQLATLLSQQFAGHGLQFFKVNRAITHVSVARPHFLDLETTPVSEGVKKIVEYLNANHKCTRRKLMEAIAPATAPAAAAEPVATPAPVAEGTATPTPAPAPPESAPPTVEQTAVIADLHWLIHQGHVIEFASGMLETAKKPLPKPPKPAKAEKQPAAGQAVVQVAVAPDAVVEPPLADEAPPAPIESGSAPKNPVPEADAPAAPEVPPVATEPQI